MSPTSAMLATTFGHGYRRPIFVARLKLAGLWLGGLFFGILLSDSLSGLPKVGNYSQVTWFATAIFTVQFAAALALTIASGAVTRSKVSLLWSALPLKERQLKFLLLFPGLALILSCLALITPTLATVCLNGGLHPFFIVAGVLIGCCATLGIAFAHTNRWLCLGLTVLVLASEYQLLGLIREGHSPWAVVTLASLLALQCLLALQAGNTATKLAKHEEATRSVGQNSLPPWGWFLKKFWRHPTLRRSFLITAVLAVGLSAAVAKYGSFSSSLATLASQLLAASLTSDVRSLARTHRPPEIYALRATSYFSRHLVSVSLFVSYLALLPLEIATIWYGLTIAPLLAYTLSGVGIGLFVGSWLTPRPGDISAQLTANLACVGIAVVASRLTTLNPSSLLLLHCWLAALGMGLGFLIEYKRNALTWRKQWHLNVPYNKK
jgi:hypothetical protein